MIVVDDEHQEARFTHSTQGGIFTPPTRKTKLSTVAGRLRILLQAASGVAREGAGYGTASTHMTLGGDHLPALVGWYAASIGNNFATPSLLHFLGDQPLPLNVLEQATISRRV